MFGKPKPEKQTEDEESFLRGRKAMELQTSPSEQRKCKDAKLILERTPQGSTRVDLGLAFSRWAALKRDRCFQTDAELAAFLLDW